MTPKDDSLLTGERQVIASQEAGSRLPKRNDLGKFAGRWSDIESEEFVKNTAVFSTVDPAEFS